MRRLRERIADIYFSFDARSLALFRIAFAIVLLVDLRLRAEVLETFYTNAGLLPNHTLLWSPPARHMFSLFFTASHAAEVRGVFMALAGLSFFALLLGYRTKLAQVTSLVALVSLNTRLAPLENGGDMVVNLLAVWSLFLPLGQRFSVDAVLGSLRARNESSAEELEDRAAMHRAPERHYSLAAFALILQFFFIYYFNVVHKTGPTWKEGTAVHYTLHQDRLITALGVWMRESLPFELLKYLAWGAVIVEAVGALMIVSPVFVKYTRLLAVLMMPGLHLAFALCLDLGVFSWGMMSFFTLLLTAEHWRWLGARSAKLHAERRVFFDAGCGICFAIARLLARLDLFARLTLVSNAQSERFAPGITAELVDTTIVVVDQGGKVHTKTAAISAILRSLPLGFPLAWLLLVPGIRQLGDLVYDRIAENRARISSFFGLAACGLPRATLAVPEEPSARTRAQTTLARSGRLAAELAVLLLIGAACGEILNANAAVPAAMRYRQPSFLQALVEYPRLLQGWRMFAPHAPVEDFMIEVDAVTIDGRHVDPYNQIASRYPGPGFTSIPPRLGQKQFFTGYSLFVWRPHFRPYLTAFEQWVLRHHERTGNPKDRILRFTAYKLSDRSPPPGQREPTNFKREVFWRYPSAKR